MFGVTNLKKLVEEIRKLVNELRDKLNKLEGKINSEKEQVSRLENRVNGLQGTPTPVVVVDPIQAKTEVVNTIVNMLLAERKEIVDRVITKLGENVEVDTSDIEESLQDSEDFTEQIAEKVLNGFDLDKIKEAVINSLVDTIIEDHLNINDLAEKVAEKISERAKLSLGE